MTSSERRALTPPDVAQAARVMSQAYVDDPLCAFMLPFKRTRASTLTKFFRVYGDLNIKGGRGFGVGDPLEGVAFWEYPDQANLSISVKSLTGFLPLLFTLYPLGLIRAREALKQTEALHQKHAKQPHFYLDNVGVAPDARGKGLSSALIRPVLELADSQKALVYTDTVTRANVSLYEHFGFQCVDEINVPQTGLTVWALRRAVQ